MQASLETNKVISLEKLNNLILFILVSSLTPLLLLYGLFGNNPSNWWHSISAAYYCNTSEAFITMMAFISYFLIISKSPLYKLAGICIACITIFPTYESTLGFSINYRVGIFQLPIKQSGDLHLFFNFLLLIIILIILIKTVLESKDFRILLFLIPILSSIIMIVIENCLHNKGNWSLHWTTIISEWVLFQTTAFIFLKRYNLKLS